jgi:hypothetical protein
LVAAVVVVYLPALQAGFIWNDSDYVTRPGLRSLAGLGRIWFEVGTTEQYYPLLHSFFWVQHQLWGDAPLGYHLTGVILHAASALLLAAGLRRWTIPGAWLAAFVFALHPVAVESVAWVAEQKNTLSLVFYLGAALAYAAFDEGRRGRMYLLASLLFVLALLSKTTTATLPPALWVLLWWRRGRLEWRRDVLPLLPWMAMATVAGLFSAWVERTYIGAEGAEFALSAGERLLLAGRILWFYVGKLVWPFDLVFIYPRWTISEDGWAQVLFLVAALGALAAAWGVRRRTRAPLAAALFFGGSLVPVLGFFNVYGFIFSYVADHWQYLPSIGLIVLACSAATRGAARFPGAVRWVVAVGVLGGLGVAEPPAESHVPRHREFLPHRFGGQSRRLDGSQQSGWALARPRSARRSRIPLPGDPASIVRIPPRPTPTSARSPKTGAAGRRRWSITRKPFGGRRARRSTTTILPVPCAKRGAWTTRRGITVKPCGSIRPGTWPTTIKG